MILECKVIHQYEIGLHTQFIGEILDSKIDEGGLDENGMPDIEKVRPFVYLPELQRYYSIGSPAGKAFDAGRKREW